LEGASINSPRSSVGWSQPSAPTVVCWVGVGFMQRLPSFRAEKVDLDSEVISSADSTRKTRGFPGFFRPIG
jgi:hypothetical protein